jgi:hypothetical protein
MSAGIIYNGGQSPLESLAIVARKKTLANNTYNNASPSNEYSATNTRALSDTKTPINGKGSGNFLDIDNYSGVGGDLDINGNPTIFGSGRNSALINNSSTWGYGPAGLNMNNYKSPNTSLNIGQVVI